MVIRCLTLLFFLLIGDNPQAAELTVELSAKQVELGKFITAHIRYIGDNKVELADLQQWEMDFWIERRNTDIETLADGQIQTLEHLRLYPRAAGDKILQAIAQGGKFAYPIDIEVLPLNRNGIDGTPHWLSLPDTVWQGQTLEIGIELPKLHPSNQFTVGQATFPGFDSRQLPTSTKAATQSDIVQFHWLLTAKQPGELSIEPPYIEQRGRGRWRFYLPQKKINVLPLPAYLPSTVPIGNVSVQTALDESQNKPLWEVTVKSDSPLPEEIFGIRTQLAEHSGRSVENVNVVTNNQETDSQKKYQVDVPSFSWGVGKGPEIRLRYFDTKSGQIEMLTARLPSIREIPPAIQYLLFIALSGVVILILFILYKLSQQLVIWSTYKKSIRHSSDAHELRKTLLKPDRLLGLESWASEINTDSARYLARQLNTLCFSRSSEVSLEELKQTAVRLHSLSHQFKSSLRRSIHNLRK